MFKVYVLRTTGLSVDYEHLFYVKLVVLLKTVSYSFNYILHSFHFYLVFDTETFRVEEPAVGVLAYGKAIFSVLNCINQHS